MKALRKHSEQNVDTRQVLNGIFARAVPFLVFFLICGFFCIVTRGKLLSVRNIKTIIGQAAFLLMGAMALNFLFSQGLMDMTMGNTIALSAVLSGYAAEYLPIPVAILTALLVGFAIGTLNGVLTAVIKLPNFIAGLSVSFALGGIVKPVVAAKLPMPPLAIMKYYNNTIQYILLALCFAVFFYLYNYCCFGKEIRAIGSGETASQQSGINITKTRMLAFMVCGLMSGIIGFLSLAKSGSATATTGQSFEFNAMIALVLGGMTMGGGSGSRFYSALLGPILVTVISLGMTLWGKDYNTQMIVKSVIFIVVLALNAEVQKIER